MAVKTIVTIGPSSNNKEVISLFQKENVSVFRINASHANKEFLEKTISIIKEEAPDVALMLDTKGPEIRTGEEELNINKDDIIIINKDLSIDYKYLEEIPVGTILLFDDGLLKAEVIDINPLKIKFLNAGFLGPKKTVSFKGYNPKVDFITTKDKEDILFAINNNFDFIAASFVRSKEDIDKLKEIINKNNSDIAIISKIEHPEALKNINEIIDNSYGIMIARGDLGVEFNLEEVPIVQLEIIKKCHDKGKPVIVATQMLESMKNNPRPTRAEVSDVANAIIQGADALMLSGETANGNYPIESFLFMKKMIEKYYKLANNHVQENNSITALITKNAYELSETLKAKIIVFTETGFTANQISRFKPKKKIIAFTRNKRVSRKLRLSWGVDSFVLNENLNEKDYLKRSVKIAYEKKLLKLNDKIILISGSVMHKSRTTNRISIYEVKEILE